MEDENAPSHRTVEQIRKLTVKFGKLVETFDNVKQTVMSQCSKDAVKSVLAQHLADQAVPVITYVHETFVRLFGGEQTVERLQVMKRIMELKVMLYRQLILTWRYLSGMSSQAAASVHQQVLLHVQRSRGSTLWSVAGSLVMWWRLETAYPRFSLTDLPAAILTARAINAGTNVVRRMLTCRDIDVHIPNYFAEDFRPYIGDARRVSQDARAEEEVLDAYVRVLLTLCRPSLARDAGLFIAKPSSLLDETRRLPPGAPTAPCA